MSRGKSERKIKLDDQVRVMIIAGTWEGLTDNGNVMDNNVSILPSVANIFADTFIST